MLQLIYTIVIDIGRGYFRGGAVTLRGAATFGFSYSLFKKAATFEGGGYFRDPKLIYLTKFNCFL